MGLDASPSRETDAGDGAEKLADRVAEFERGVIAVALRAHHGSLKPVYESLGISRKTLYEKMQKYDLYKSDA
jgi:two-component system C4-dicarboxylate transport response regulator DctD